MFWKKEVNWRNRLFLVFLFFALLCIGIPVRANSKYGKLDRNVLMLDKHRYRFAYLQIENKQGDWKPVFRCADADIATVNQKGKVLAKKAGKTTITLYAKYPGRKKKKVDTCSLRVITNAWEALPGDTRTVGINKVTIKNPLWTNRRDNCYSDEEVESYINNSADLIRRQPDRWSEGKKKNIYGWETTQPWQDELKPTKENYRRIVFHKEAGEISANGWIIFFSSKAQYLWILKEQKDGSWKIEDKGPVSGGYDCGSNTKEHPKDGGKYFNSYLCTKNGGSIPFGISSWYGWIGWKDKNAPTNYSNAIHEGKSGVRNGIPTSAGCIHTGSGKGHLHQTIDRAGVGTRIIRY